MDRRGVAGYTLALAVCALGGASCALVPAAEDSAALTATSAATTTEADSPMSSVPAGTMRLTSPPPVASSPEPAPSVAPAEDGAVAAYRGMWAAFVVAAETSDYDSVELGRYANGEVLRWMQSSLYTDSQAGLVTKGQPGINPQVQVDGATASEATVTDCLNTTGWLKHRADTGEVAVGQAGGQREVTAVVGRVLDAWSVAQIYIGPVGTC